MQKFSLDPFHASTRTRASNQFFFIPHANQTTLFLMYRVDHAICPGHFFVTGMLTRDLFAVANFLFITFYSAETVAVMCV